MGNYKFDMKFDDKICTKIVENQVLGDDMQLLVGPKNYAILKEELPESEIFLHYVFHKIGSKKGEMTLGISSDSDDVNGYDQNRIRKNILPAFMKERYIEMKECYKGLNLPEKIKKYSVIRSVKHGSSHR